MKVIGERWSGRQMTNGAFLLRRWGRRRGVSAARCLSGAAARRHGGAVAYQARDNTIMKITTHMTDLCALSAVHAVARLAAAKGMRALMRRHWHQRTMRMKRQIIAVTAWPYVNARPQQIAMTQTYV